MSWFRCPQVRPYASIRLICFPHAGGSAVFYRSWAEKISPAVEVHAVQYPGRSDRLWDPLIGDAGQIAALISGAMGPLLDRPVALFGHSMGAVLAYETARILQTRGTGPVHLFVSGARAPHDRDAVERIADYDEDSLVAELVKLGGTDAALLQDPEMRELILPYVRNDFRLIESYRQRPGEALSCPVTAMLGDADPHVTPEQAARWSQTTSAGFTLTTLPGDHFYLAPQRSAVLGEVLRALNVPLVP